MKKLLTFFTSKTFFANLLLAMIFFVAIFWVINKGLAIITHHSQRIAVPDLTGLSLSEVEKLLEKDDLLYKVIDSTLFDPNKPFGSVIDQFPLAGAEVKEGRVIMLSINPFEVPKFEIPDIIEKTLRRALYDIESKGFVVGTLTYVPDIGKDVVLGVQIGNQATQPGEKFVKGTVLNLIVGAGLSNEPVPVPYLLGLVAEEARLKAQTFAFNIGVIIYDESVIDTLQAKVYRQSPKPSRSPKVRMGTPIDLWFTNDSTKLPSDSLFFYNEGLYENAPNYEAEDEEDI